MNALSGFSVFSGRKQRAHGGTRNLLLAAAAWNFKKWLNLVVSFWLNLLRLLLHPSECPALRPSTF